MFRLLTTVVVSFLAVFNPLVVASDNLLQSQFEKFIINHNKQYQSHDEYQYRMSIFSENVKYINNHNSQNKSFTLGINQFADLSNKEFSARFTPMKVNKKSLKDDYKCWAYQNNINDCLANKEE
jgi:hypothetical protein